MQLKTLAIVLHALKYTDKKQICKLYTKDFGLQSYMVNVGNSAASKIKPALILPLNQLEIIVFARENQNLGKLNEARCYYHYTSLYSNVLKGTMATFLNEVLYRCLHEQESNTEMYQFIVSSFQNFDRAAETNHSFHLQFMAALSRHIGFFPLNNFNASNSYFDMIDGRFAASRPLHPHYLERQEAEDFSRLFDESLQIENAISLPKTQRKTLLENLIRYYQLHVPGFKEIKSLPVLQATFN